MMTQHVKDEFSSEPFFKVAFIRMPDKLDSSVINSVGDYVLMEHLMIPLVGYNSTGVLSGVLANKWEIEDDYKTYIFYIENSHLFSNGVVIEAKHVVASIQRSIRFQKAIHYDFSNIKEIKLLNRNKLSIVLNKRDPFLLYDLEHPEFRVLWPNDSDADKYQQDFQVSSGPYSLIKIDKSGIYMKKNAHYFYYNTENKVAPNKIHFIDNLLLFKDKNVFKNQSPDLAWSPAHLDNETLKFIKEQSYSVKNPRLGFSYWISLNASSPQLKDIESRKYLQNLLRINRDEITKIDALLEPSDELFFPGGSGGLPSQFLSEFWKNRGKLSKPNSCPSILTLLVYRNFQFTEIIKEKLHQNGIKLVVHYYDNLTEYYTMIKESKKYDLMLINNDFLTMDLRGALNVSLNQSSPQIIPDSEDRKFQELMNEMNTSIDDSTRSGYIKKIGEHLLTEAYVTPIYYFNSYVFYKNNFSLELWSNIITDVGVWKIKTVLGVQ